MLAGCGTFRVVTGGSYDAGYDVTTSQYAPKVREELETLARPEQLTYYKELGAVIGKPQRWTLWKAVLDEISYTKPDLTIIVLNAKSGRPSQIAYKFTDKKPSTDQKAFAQEESEKIFQRYCRSRPVPKLPKPKQS